MIYKIRHITEYKYHSPVSLCYNQAHLLPRDTLEQNCAPSNVVITPKPNYMAQHSDYFGNHYVYFSLQKPHTKLVIDVTTEINSQNERAAFALELGISCKAAREMLMYNQDPDTIQAKEYILDSPMIRPNTALKAYAEALFQDDIPLLSAARALTTKIFNDFKYDPSSTTVATPLDEVLQRKSGVCQDFAHIAIGCLRALGYPARYVSGYLETLPPPGQEKLVGADASHAWFAIYSPGEGWFEFDPTNDDIPKEQHITTAWGRDYSDVTPLKGVIFDGGNSHQLSVSVDVRRLEQ
ncbi:transglutaminase family protein [Neptuniibacter marinus]|uniref:transglutaminase family protein n=1 Tax=Neptuniibacter marinus TaxID=1806670 RepID=UPI000836A11D|nr:transglutaminase family protein [Neptuniibacter marinus]